MYAVRPRKKEFWIAKLEAGGFEKNGLERNFYESFAIASYVLKSNDTKRLSGICPSEISIFISRIYYTRIYTSISVEKKLITNCQKYRQ